MSMVSILVSIELLFRAIWCSSIVLVQVQQGKTIPGKSASGAVSPPPRGLPCQGEGRGFETRVPLQERLRPTAAGEHFFPAQTCSRRHVHVVRGSATFTQPSASPSQPVLPSCGLTPLWRRQRWRLFLHNIALHRACMSLWIFGFRGAGRE